MNHLNDHKGTYRHERFPKALDPNYFKLDERSSNDIIEQTAMLASYIKYYNEQHLEDGNWEAFFENIYDYVHHEVDFQKIDEWEKNAQAPPHLALYLAFVEVFRIAQDELNRFSQRHLEYYYKNILGFESNMAVPDKVYLFFQIDKKAIKTQIPKGTLFEGGNDKNGKKRLYVSDFDLTVNKSEIEQIKTLSIKTFKKDNKNYLDFTTQDNILTDKASHPADIGFAISSPMFYLKDGKRTLEIKFCDKKSARLVHTCANVEYSSPLGWQPVPMKYDPKEERVSITATKALPSFAIYDEEVHQMHIKAKDPVLRFVFSKGEPIAEGNRRELFALGVNLISSIKVNVEDSKDLLLYNDYGRLNSDMPFMPFGPNPIPQSSRFLMGNNKIFNKYLRSFEVNIKWKGIPDDIEKYYQTYNDGWDLLSERQKNLYKSFKENNFSKFSRTKLPGRLLYLNNGNWLENLEFTNEGDSIREMVRDYTNQTKSGFVQVVSSIDYGHTIFGTLLGKVMLENTKTSVKEQKTVPEKPYTPEIQNLSINYTLSEALGLQTHQLFSIHPFQNIEIDRAEGLLFQTLVSKELSAESETNNEKYYYISLANATSDSEVSVYFDIFNPDPFDNGNRYFWSYFNGREWVPFESNMIVRDTTTSFSRSGILSFIIPREALFSDDVPVWLAVLIRGKGDKLPEILHARTNCVTATFKDDNNELSHLKKGLPERLIQKFVEKNPEIKSVEQPYSSFGGKEAENEKDFYTRISERLRHKNRASSAWDYEHLVLEAFPQISFALCIAHSRIANKNSKDSELEFAPGNVFLLVSPNTHILVQENALRPIVPMQILNEIHNYLKTIASPHVDIQVSNFSYKPIKIKCKVQLKKGFSDATFYRDKINGDLIDFISPWVSSRGDKYRKSLIYNSKNVADIYFFLENLEYIDFVVSAEIEVEGKEYSISDCTIDKKEHEIFTSVTNHNITIVYNG